MTFKPAIWYPIAVGLSVLNLVGVGFAAGEPQPWHAALHATLALAFGLWAQRLRQGPAGRELQSPIEGLEGEVDALRAEVAELHERMDFAERLLAQAQAPETRRVGPQ
jgi:hypothetical protein